LTDLPGNAFVVRSPPRRPSAGRTERRVRSQLRFTAAAQDRDVLPAHPYFPAIGGTSRRRGGALLHVSTAFGLGL